MIFFFVFLSNIYRYEFLHSCFHFPYRWESPRKAYTWTVGWPLEIREFSFRHWMLSSVFTLLFLLLLPHCFLSNSAWLWLRLVRRQFRFKRKFTSNGIFLPFFFLIVSSFRVLSSNWIYRFFYTFPVHYSWYAVAVINAQHYRVYEPYALTLNCIERHYCCGDCHGCCCCCAVSIRWRQKKWHGKMRYQLFSTG